MENYLTQPVEVIAKKTGLNEVSSFFLTNRRYLFEINAKMFLSKLSLDEISDIIVTYKKEEIFKSIDLNKLYYYLLVLNEVFEKGCCHLSSFEQKFSEPRVFFEKLLVERIFEDCMSKTSFHVYELKARFDFLSKLDFTNNKKKKACFYLVETIVENIDLVKLTYEEKYSWYDKFEKFFDIGDNTDVYKIILSYKKNNPLEKKLIKNYFSHFKGGFGIARCTCGLYSRKSKDNHNCSNCGGTKPEKPIFLRSV